MKLLVLGASGGCGGWLTRLARDRGHEVTAVVRAASRGTLPDGVETLEGEVLDAGFLRAAVEPHRLILSALGLRRAGKSPWARLQSPPDLVTRVMTNLVAAVGDRGVRVLWISAGGVGDSRELVTPMVRWMIAAGNVGVAYRDLEAAERVMTSSPIDALAVRPVTLLGGRPSGRSGPVRRYGLFSGIRRSDVAQWMLDVVDGTRALEERAVLLGRSRA